MCVLLGAQKSGTSFLANCVARHPLCHDHCNGVPRQGSSRCRQCMDAGDTGDATERWCVSCAKEAALHELKRRRIAWELPAPTVQNVQGFGFSGHPRYLLGGFDMAERFAATGVPHRFLVVLRDPVSRAWSQYSAVKRKAAAARNGNGCRAKPWPATNWDQCTFASLVAEEVQALRVAGVDASSTPVDWHNLCVACEQNFVARYQTEGHGDFGLVARGLYVLQLLPWLRVFGMERVRVLFLTDLIERPEAEMHGLWEFLRVETPPFDPMADVSKPRHVGQLAEPLPAEVAQLLRSFYAPFDSALWHLLGLAPRW